MGNPSTVWAMPKVGGAYPEAAATLQRSTSAMGGRIAVPLLQSSPSLKRPASSAGGICVTSPELMERRQVRKLSPRLSEP